MLPHHGRYDYSSIVSRPDYAWPGGRRLAVYLAVNIEAFGFGVGKGAAIAPPDQAQSHSIYSWRDYGNRVGIWRLLDLFDELDLPIEAQMNTAVYDLCPDIPARLRRKRQLAPRSPSLRRCEVLASLSRSRSSGHSPGTSSRGPRATDVRLATSRSAQRRRRGSARAS